MQEFEIDVSGQDLLNKDYVICIANKDGIIRGFKFDEDMVKVICSRFGQGLYKYKKSKNGKSLLKIRIYSIVIYFLFKSLNLKGDISLIICRDFEGRENDIKENLKFFLEAILGLKIEDRIRFDKLDKYSNANRYAYLMRKDKKDQMNTYIKLTLNEIEKWLIK